MLKFETHMVCQQIPPKYSSSPVFMLAHSNVYTSRILSANTAPRCFTASSSRRSALAASHTATTCSRSCRPCWFWPLDSRLQLWYVFQIDRSVPPVPVMTSYNQLRACVGYDAAVAVLPAPPAQVAEGDSGAQCRADRVLGGHRRRCRSREAEKEEKLSNCAPKCYILH